MDYLSEYDLDQYGSQGTGSITDQLVNKLIKQAYLTSPRSSQKSKRAIADQPVNSQSNSDNSSTKEVQLITNPVQSETKSGAQYLVDPATGKRLSRAERQAYEANVYQTEKQQANNDVLRNVLIGAGVLGIGALLGRKSLARGAELAKDYHLSREVGKNYENLDEYLKVRPSVIDPRFWAASIGDPAAKVEQQARLKELYSNPLKTLGALGYRLGLDVVTDGTRSRYWRYNHPLAIVSSASEKLIDPLNALSPTQKAVLTFSAAVPAVAASGAYDISNPSELFRPPGYKQNIPNPDDPRESTEPVNELFQRFFMGRTGRPLKYDEAKKDILDLTPERYKEYLRYTYQDKGLFNLGMIKGTNENLQGVPELRMLGYPVTVPMVTIAALGGIGSGLATALSEKQYTDDMEKLVRQKMDIQNVPGSASKTYIEYVPEVIVDPHTAEIFKTGKYIPDSKRTVISSVADLPDPRSRSTIERYVGSKPASVRRRQLLMGLAGIGVGAAAGHFLGNYINQIIANQRNNPDKLMSTEEYGIS